MGFGAILLDAIIEHDDTMGHLANAKPDELRDALRLAASRLRDRRTRTERDPLVIGARRLVAEVWRLVADHKLNARSMAADAALDLRDTIDTQWMPVAKDERSTTDQPHERVTPASTPVDDFLRRKMENALRDHGRPNWMVEGRICAAVAHEHYGGKPEPVTSDEYMRRTAAGM